MATNASAFICAFTRKGGRGSTRTHQHYFREKMNKLSQTHLGSRLKAQGSRFKEKLLIPLVRFNKYNQ
jgi:hypothetical protein